MSQLFFKKMGCVKLHILDEQYKRTELKVSYINKELTFSNSTLNSRRWILIRFIDPDGKEPRLYVETTGFGHAFVTTGTGNNTTVYTYGRYGELGKDKSFARSTTPTGEGVLIRLTGDEAKSFIQDQITNKGAVAFEFTKGSDEAVMKHFDDKFNSSDKSPTTGKYAGNENAKVVDTYNVLTNNCVTVSVEGVQSGSKENLKLGDLKGPMAVRDVLNVQSGKQESNVIKITPEEIKKELDLP